MGALYLLPLIASVVLGGTSILSGTDLSGHGDRAMAARARAMWGVTDQDLHAAIRRAGGPERRRSKTFASRTSRSVTGYQRVTSRIDPSASTALASVAVGIPLLLTIGAPKDRCDRARPGAAGRAAISA
jgi:hypothetical protein